MSMPQQHAAPPARASDADAIKFSLPRIFRWSAQVASASWLLFSLSLAATLVVSLGTQLQSVLFGAVIGKLNQGSEPGPKKGGAAAADLLQRLVPEQLDNAAFLLLAIVVIVLLLSFSESSFRAFADERMLARLQIRLHDKLLLLGTAWHDGRDPGTGSTLVSQYARGAQPIFIEALRSPLVQGIGLASGSALLVANLARLPHTPLAVQLGALVVLLGAPVLAWRLSRTVQVAFAATIAADQQVITEAANSFTQPTDVILLDARAQRTASFAKRAREAARARLRTALRGDLLREMMASLPSILQGVFLVYGVLVLIAPGGGGANAEAIGAIVSIYLLVPLVVAPLLGLIGFFTGLGSQWPILAQIGAVLDAEPAMRDAPNAVAWPDAMPSIALAKVRFRYDAGSPLLLDGVSHRFETGKVTAIVGRSGAGKTTVLQLLSRARDPAEGAVMVDDTPLTGIRINEVRRHIVVVSQFPAFLTDTVRANLLLGRADASDAELEAAARRTGIWPVLEAKSPHAPLDCPMMREAGKDFSGGERRLLAVTRALLRRPTLLLLDEPTTGIDAINLESVLHALRAAAEGVTTVLIEHNLDFVSAMADTVCVLDRGHFVEVGAPAELAAAFGLYHELVEARRRIAEGGKGMQTTSYPASRLASAGSSFANMSAGDGPPPDIGSLPVSPLSGRKKVLR